MKAVRIENYALREKLSAKAAVLEYLRKGKTAAAVAGAMKDAVTGERTGVEYTWLMDDVYTWSTELIYHVEKYDCQLPRDFLTHIESRIN